jgi:hypothetical protein
MRADELFARRARLEGFAGEVFTPLYLHVLLLDGRRKSMQPRAGRLGVDHQQLQQFRTTSTWPVEAVRAQLARRAVAVVRPQVWVVGARAPPPVDNPPHGSITTRLGKAVLGIAHELKMKGDKGSPPTMVNLNVSVRAHITRSFDDRHWPLEPLPSW